MGHLVMMRIALQRGGDDIHTRLLATGDRARVFDAKGVA
jgi:hypothetical protein